jgi:CheY-like chemotaxis protein
VYLYNYNKNYKQPNGRITPITDILLRLEGPKSPDAGTAASGASPRGRHGYRHKVHKDGRLGDLFQPFRQTTPVSDARRTVTRSWQPTTDIGVSKLRGSRAHHHPARHPTTNYGGYVVARALRCIEALCYTPIVAVTSYAMVGDREKCLAAAAMATSKSRLIRKPSWQR